MSVFDKLKGRKLALCDILYQEPSKRTGWKDYISFVYKDTITGEKEVMNIENPEYDIYSVKPEHRTFRKPRHYMPIDQCDRHTIKYKDRYREIAKIAGENSSWMNYYKANFSNRKKIDQLYKYPYVLGADMPIESYYRVKWEKEVGNADGFLPSCIYLDIEVDTIEWVGRDIPRHGECPINAISVVDDITNTVYQFLYKTPGNPQIDDFINRQDEYQKMLHDAFDETYGNGKPMTYNIYMFTNELELIKATWKLIHSLKRDFMLIWNAPFDMPYMEERLVVLGVEPQTVLCHSDFASTLIYFRLDEKKYEQALKRDYYDISMYTRVINQLSLYPSLRRSKGAIRRLNLGAVAKAEINDEKLDYSDVENFVQFPYQQYMRFAMYNIKDTLLQMGINRKCRDMITYYNSCYSSFCGYKDGLKQTVSLRSLFYYELLEDGYIIGNNANFDNYDPNDKKKKKNFSGAINGDSMLNEFEGLEIFGKKSMFYFGRCIDFDFSGMYPNIMLVWNIFAVCMIGKLFIEHDEIYRRYDKDGGKEFVEDFIAENSLYLGQKWFGLPSFTALLEIVQSRLEKSVGGCM